MVKIILSEHQLYKLKESQDSEITFYEFILVVKEFLKELASNPSSVGLPIRLNDYINSSNELIDKLIKYDIIEPNDTIKEVPIDDLKKKAKRIMSYNIHKNMFMKKMKKLYNDIVLMENLNEDGASSCGSVMQGGGDNPSAGQYEMPFTNVQRRDFWNSSLSRKKNKSLIVSDDE